MDHSLPLITTIATALGLALILGFIAVKLKLPILVGYLMAGIVLGPFTPGYIANSEIAAELAEIGVMLLMFGVGLHFSLDNLLETRKIALPGALIQIVVTTILGGCLGLLWGWGAGGAIVFGIALSVASTVVLIKALEEQGSLATIDGQIAVGWLIVEDLAMILALVFLPLIASWLGVSNTMSPEKSIWTLLGITFIKISGFIVMMLILGRWGLPKLLWHITRTGSRELFTLCIIAAAVSIAFGAARIFGISLALGAFFSGMIIRESKFSQRAAEESLPFRDAFAVLFFVSVGMLFNPYIFIDHPFKILLVVATIVFGKSIVAFILVLAFRYPLHAALTVAASLSQIGEFSFILASQGVYLHLFPMEAQELILGGALISIAMNPFIFKLVPPLEDLVYRKFSKFKIFRRSQDPLGELPISTDSKYLSAQVVLIGYGRVGRRIGRILTEHGIPYVVVEQNRELVEQIRLANEVAVYGNASDPAVLIQAHIAKAGMLMLATADTFNIRQMVNIARKLNPKIEVAIRVSDEEEACLLKRDIDATFFLSEQELAKGMSELILVRFGASGGMGH